MLIESSLLPILAKITSDNTVTDLSFPDDLFELFLETAAKALSNRIVRLSSTRIMMKIKEQSCRKFMSGYKIVTEKVRSTKIRSDEEVLRCLSM